MVGFQNLSPHVVSKVVDKFIAQLEIQLSDRSVSIELTEAARSWLADTGYDRAYGARPLARVIQEHVKKPLAEELLFGRLSKGGHIKVVVRDKKLSFEFGASDGAEPVLVPEETKDEEPVSR